MPNENSITLTNIKAYLSFYIHDEDGNGQDTTVEVGCAEDIQNMMELFFHEKYEDLFGNEYDRWSSTGATFLGIEFYHTDDQENRIAMKIHGDHKFGSASFNYEALGDQNADKMKRIREIMDEQ